MASYICFHPSFFPFVLIYVLTLASTLPFTKQKAKMFDLEGEEKIEMVPGALEFSLWIYLGQEDHLEGKYLRKQDN